MPDSRLRALVLTLGALLAVLLATWPGRWAHAVPPRVAGQPAWAGQAGQPGQPGQPGQVRGIGRQASPAAGWRAPLTGRLKVTRPFVPPLSPYGPGHRGVDLAAPPGTALHSAGSGTVRFAARLAGRGVVVVDSGEIRTTYEPVRATVRVGQQVRAGDVIGLLDPGHPGCPEAACLHWGALRGQVYLDPLTLLQNERPRLLPYLGRTAGADATPATPGRPTTAAPPAAGRGLAIRLGSSAAAGTGVGLLIIRRRRALT